MSNDSSSSFNETIIYATDSTSSCKNIKYIKCTKCETDYDSNSTCSCDSTYT